MSFNDDFLMTIAIKRAIIRENSNERNLNLHPTLQRHQLFAVAQSRL